MNCTKIKLSKDKRTISKNGSSARVPLGSIFIKKHCMMCLLIDKEQYCSLLLYLQNYGIIRFLKWECVRNTEVVCLFTMFYCPKRQS